MKIKKKNLIRCDASKNLGYGHVVRCLALADELSKKWKWQINFAIKNNQDVKKIIEKKNYKTIIYKNSRSNYLKEKEWLMNIINFKEIKILVLDIKNNLSASFIKSLSKSKIMIVTIDDSSNRRLYSNLSFYPPVPQVKQLNWKCYKGKMYSGWDSIILRKQFLKQKKKINKRNIILVTMGGSDTFNLTLPILKILDKMKMKFTVKVILGQGFKNYKKLIVWTKKSKRKYNFFQNVSNIAKIMRSSNLAIISFGMTAYELAALGTYALILSNTKDHYKSAQILENQKFGINVGKLKNLSEKKIKKAINDSLNKKMFFLKNKYSKKKFLRKGTFSVAKKINDNYKEFKA